MSKSVPIIIIAAVVAIVATALTLFAQTHNTRMSCFEPDIVMGADIAHPLTTELRAPGATSSDSPPVYAIEKGFPLKYYRQAFPAACTFPDGGPAPTSSQIDAGHLAIDLLAWFILVLAVLLGVNRTRAKS